MLIVFTIILSVIALDLLVAGLFIHKAFLILSAGIMIGIYYFWHRRAKNQIANQTDGWLLGQGVDITNPDQPLQIKNVFLPRASSDLGLMMSGASGSGKTMATIAYIKHLNDHHHDDAIVLGDGKGNIEDFKKSVAAGIQWDYFFSSELDGTCDINLLEGEPADAADRCERLLIGHTASTSFYADAQRTAIQTIIPLMKATGLPCNLRDFFAVLTIEDAGHELLAVARERKVNEVILRMAKEFFSQGFEARFKEMKGLANRAFIFSNGPRNHRINSYSPSLNISEAINSGKKIFLHLPLSEFATDLAIALVEVFGVEARQRQQQGPEKFNTARFMLDDWGGYFYSNFGRIAARCRSAKMPFMFGFQSQAQPRSASENFANELDALLLNKVILRQVGQWDVELSQKLMGMYETVDVGASEMGERRGSSLNVIEKYRLKQQSFKELLPGEAYLSTIVESKTQAINKLYKLRFPYIAQTNAWQNVTMPTALPGNKVDGLNLWDRFLNPSRLEEIKNIVNFEEGAVA